MSTFSLVLELYETASKEIIAADSDVAKMRFEQLALYFMFRSCLEGYHMSALDMWLGVQDVYSNRTIKT
jgi:hypothetical protein